MVEVVEMFTFAFEGIAPTNLGLEVVVVLGEVFFTEVVGVVAAAVAPLEDVGGVDVGVLEVVFGVVSVLAVLGVLGHLWEGQGGGHRQGKDNDSDFHAEAVVDELNGDL